MILLFLLLMSRKPFRWWDATLLTCSTSGLDASIALSVMQVLRDIAATGRTVIGKFTCFTKRCQLTLSYYTSTSK
jgi:hypothetical protein